MSVCVCGWVCGVGWGVGQFRFLSVWGSGGVGGGGGDVCVSVCVCVWVGVWGRVGSGVGGVVLGGWWVVVNGAFVVLGLVWW